MLDIYLPRTFNCLSANHFRYFLEASFKCADSLIEILVYSRYKKSHSPITMLDNTFIMCRIITNFL